MLAADGVQERQEEEDLLKWDDYNIWRKLQDFGRDLLWRWMDT